MHSGDYHFSSEDILANRLGRLSLKQDELIEAIYQTRRRQAKQTMIAFIIFFALLTIVGIGIEFNQWEGSIASFVEEMGFIFLMMIGGFAGLLSVSMGIHYLMNEQLRQRRIRDFEGLASVLVQEAYARGYYMRYELRFKQGFMRSRLFRYTSEAALRQFEDGKHYHVYYLDAYPPIVLSAEELY